MKSKDKTRFKQRLNHHLILGLISIVMLSGVYFTLKSPDATFKWSMSTAYVSLLLLGGYTAEIDHVFRGNVAMCSAAI